MTPIVCLTLIATTHTLQDECKVSISVCVRTPTTLKRICYYEIGLPRRYSAKLCKTRRCLRAYLLRLQSPNKRQIHDSKEVLAPGYKILFRLLLLLVTVSIHIVHKICDVASRSRHWRMIDCNDHNEKLHCLTYVWVGFDWLLLFSPLTRLQNLATKDGLMVCCMSVCSWLLKLFYSWLTQ